MLDKTKRHIKRNIFITLMLLWPLVHFAIFWIYVNINTIRMTLWTFDTQNATYTWFGFKRFVDIFERMILGQDMTLRNSLKNSLLSFPVQNFIILPLSIFCAFFMFKKIPMAGFYRVVFFLPSIISIVVLTMAFRFMFHSDFGPFKIVIEKLFHVAPDYFSSFSPTAMPMVFLFGIWAGLGYNIILINGAMGRIPPEVIEYSKLDGIGLFREMFQIIIPLIWPTISTLFVIGTLGVFGFFLQPMLLCGEGGGFMGNTSTVAMQVVYMMKSSRSSDAAAIGLFFSVIGIPFVFAIKGIMEKITPTVDY